MAVITKTKNFETFCKKSVVKMKVVKDKQFANFSMIFFTKCFSIVV